MNEDKRQAILAKITSNIESHGYHLRVVDGGPLPRFAYTIGMHPRAGFEFVFVGGAFFTLEDTKAIIASFVSVVLEGRSADGLTASVGDLGTFALRSVDASWSSKLLLGAIDHFKLSAVKAFQIVPDDDHWTIDVPDVSESWDSETHAIWRWLGQDWDLPFSARAIAITNLDALRGYAISEVMRWEENEWEMFSGAGPDVPQAEIRSVPLATMVAFDPSLMRVLQLGVGSGIWREDVGAEWHTWSKRE